MTQERSPKGIGAKLHEARKRRGVSLRQVAESTKIPVSILQALERNDISRLPGGLFGRGFVRSFATAAGLDPEATVAEFVAQFPLESVTDGYPAAPQVDEKEVSAPPLPEVSRTVRWWEASTSLRLVAVAVFFAAVIAYVGATKGWPQWTATPSGTATIPTGPADRPVRFDVPNEQAVRAGSSEVPVETQRSDQPSASSAAPDPPVAPTALANSPAIPAAPVGGDSTPVTASSAPRADVASDSSSTNVESLPLASGREDADAAAPSRNPLAVVLSVTSPSWVIATVDGKKILNRLIEIGEQEMLEARRELVLTTGDAGAIVMTLNGAVAKSLGRPGEAITARVSRTNFKRYLRQ